jgi:hypothetical protein
MTDTKMPKAELRALAEAAMESGVLIQKCPTKTPRGNALKAWAPNCQKRNYNAKVKASETMRPTKKRLRERYGSSQPSPYKDVGLYRFQRTRG